MKKLLKNFPFAKEFHEVKIAIHRLGKNKIMLISAIVIFCIVEIVCSVLYTNGIRGVINSFQNVDRNLFVRSILLIISNYIIWWVYAPISSWVTSKASKITIRDLKTDFILHLIKLPMSYHDKTSKGELISALSNDIRGFSGIYDWSLFQVMRSFSGGLGGLVTMAVIDIRFALIVFTLGTLTVYTTSYFSKKLEKSSDTMQELLSKSSTDIFELLRASKTIRLLKIQERKIKRTDESISNETKIKIENGIISAKMNSITSLINMISHLLVLTAGAVFVRFGLSDWGTVVALTGLKYTADMLFVECGQFMAQMQGNLSGVRRILEIEKAPEESENPLHYRFTDEDNENSISVNHVNFSYNENDSEKVLHDFSMDVKSTGITCLIGTSGSGKSTILKLLTGQYFPSSGEISFSAESVSDTLSLEDIRMQSAYVPQEPMLFRGSVYENIACGNRYPDSVSEADIMSAAVLAEADKFIREMPDGYRTEITDSGSSLSGGQKQRIAIARALIKNAPVLLLDEITSALDSETESQIIETVKKISLRKSVLIITHNELIAKSADTVYKLN